MLNCKVTALKCKFTIHVESFWNILYLHVYYEGSFSKTKSFTLIHDRLLLKHQINQGIYSHFLLMLHFLFLNARYLFKKRTIYFFLPTEYSKRVYQGVRVKHTVKDLLAEKRLRQTNAPRYSVSLPSFSLSCCLMFLSINLIIPYPYVFYTVFCLYSIREIIDNIQKNRSMKCKISLTQQQYSEHPC